MVVILVVVVVAVRGKSVGGENVHDDEYDISYICISVVVKESVEVHS